MRTILFALLLAVAAAAWFSLSWKADKDSVAIKERFEAETSTPPRTEPDPLAPKPGMTAEEKQRAVTSDVMDVYRDLYGKYPITEYLVHYRDLAATMSKEEIKARIKSDGGTPPGVSAPSQTAAAEISAMKPPVPGDSPILPASMKDGSQDAALPVKLMNLAMQLSALSEEVAAQQRAPKGPKAFESFISFRS